MLCSTVHIATSFFGFLLFGDHTLDDLLPNFDGELEIPYSSLLNDVVRVSYVIHLMLVFPIVFFSLLLNMDCHFFLCAIPIAQNNHRFLSVKATLVCLIFFGANCVPKIWDAFKFTGATTTVFVGFTYSAAIVLRWVPSSLFNYLSVIILTYLSLILHVCHWSKRYTWNWNQEGQASFIGHDIVRCFLK